MSLSEKRDAFEKLYLRARPRVFNLVNRTLCSADDAEDITQTAFVKAWASFEWYDPSRPFEAWVFRIALNLVRDDHRRRVRWQTYSLTQTGDQSSMDGGHTLPEPVDANPTPEETVLADTISEPLLTALRGLPADHRRCLVLAGQDIPYAQIAARLDCPVGTVRSRVSRARVRVKQTLGACQEWAAR